MNAQDATLKRCFGKDKKIIDCTWEYIRQQETLAEPHEQMPSLEHLLEYLASPGLEHIWVLLDIKVPLFSILSPLSLPNRPQLDVPAEQMIRLIAKSIASTPPAPSKPWNKRIVLGCWAAKYFPLCAQYLPTFPTSFIGFSIPYARQFLKVPNMSFNMLQKSLVVPYVGPRFIKDAKKKNRPVYTWTVDELSMMRWSIREGLDGVVTDDPKRFLEVCQEWEGGKREVVITWRQWAFITWVNLMVIVFGVLFWWKYGWSVAKRQERGKKRRGKISLPAEEGETMGER